MIAGIALLLVALGPARAEDDGDFLEDDDELEETLDDLELDDEIELGPADPEPHAPPPDPHESLDGVDLGLEARDTGPKDVPHRKVGLTLVSGAVVAQTPLAGTVAASFGLRPKPGLRIDVEVESWLGLAYLPGTTRVLPVAVPSVGGGVAYEAPTRGAARPWIGAAAARVVATSAPPSPALNATARVGVDVGRSVLAWRVMVSGGVMLAPWLPMLSGPTYDAVCPVFSASTGPSVRL